MGKYELLRDHLRRRKSDAFELAFAEIERVPGAMPPNSASRPRWWADVSDPDAAPVQREAWRSTGFDAFLVAGRDRVRFRRVR